MIADTFQWLLEPKDGENDDDDDDERWGKQHL
jgi:hypothetical protein